jgi:hypothetical protein
METPNKIYLCEGLDEITWCEDRVDDEDVEYIKTSLIAKEVPVDVPFNDVLCATPMTLEEVVEKAAKHLPEGYVIDIQIEKDGYGVGLITKNGRLQLDGGDGIISDINEGICVANEFGA